MPDAILIIQPEVSKHLVPKALIFTTGNAIPSTVLTGSTSESSEMLRVLGMISGP